MAVSGGPDSLALLLLAEAALPGRVEAATVDHRLRPENADEAAMVSTLCGELGVPHETLPVTVEPGNLQDRARAARYTALTAWCERRELAALATGHQLDDQAETLVMRLNRGSGLAGLVGIHARIAVSGATTLLRPLLGWRQTQLEEIVVASGLKPACDPSNTDERFDRTRIRQALRTADWLDPEALAKSAAFLFDADTYVFETLNAVWEARVKWDGEAYRFMPGASDFEAGEIASRIVGAMGGVARRGDVAALVARLRRGENASLGGVLARVAGDEWHFGREPPRKA